MSSTSHDTVAAVSGGSSDRITLLLLLLFSMVVPTLCAVAVVILDVPVAFGGYETGKYTVVTYDWLENGIFITGNEGADGQRLNTTRMPLYPAFLAAVFVLFGNDNFTVVLLIQTVMAGLTIFFTALAAREFNSGWLWPAAFLAAVTVNIAYRGTLALPDGMLTLLTSIVVFCALKALSSERALSWLLAMGIFAAMALMTRPVFQFILLLALPVYAVAFAVHRQVSLLRAATWVMIPAAFMLTVYAAQLSKVYVLTGHAAFSTQSGFHSLHWVIPCLAQPYGCGEINNAKHAETKKRLADRLALLSEEDRKNPVIVSQHQRELALEMLLEMPPLATTTAAVASVLKMMFHSMMYEVLDRASLKAVYFSQIPATTIGERIGGFLSAIFASVPMVFWLVSQIAVIGSRVFEIVGMVSGAFDKTLRWKTLFLITVAIALLGPGIGIGNPRYRTPAEPVLVILLLQGLATAFAVVASMTRTRVQRADGTN